MKRKLIFILVMLVIISSVSFGCSQQTQTKYYGDEMMIDLETNQKLQLVTWKEDSIWYLTRPMREDEFAETYTYQQQSPWGIVEGKVTIIETKKDYTASTECTVAINSFSKEEFLNAFDEKMNNESNLKTLFENEGLIIYRFYCIGDPLNIKEKVDCVVIETNYGEGEIYTEYYKEKTVLTIKEILSPYLTEEELETLNFEYTF